MLKKNQFATFNHKAILNGNRSIKTTPSSAYVNKTKAYGNQVGIITRVFDCKHNGNLTMPDGKIFHVQSNQVNIVCEGYMGCSDCGQGFLFPQPEMLCSDCEAALQVKSAEERIESARADLFDETYSDLIPVFS